MSNELQLLNVVGLVGELEGEFEEYYKERGTLYYRNYLIVKRKKCFKHSEDRILILIKEEQLNKNDSYQGKQVHVKGSLGINCMVYVKKIKFVKDKNPVNTVLFDCRKFEIEAERIHNSGSVRLDLKLYGEEYVIVATAWNEVANTVKHSEQNQMMHCQGQLQTREYVKKGIVHHKVEFCITKVGI